VKNAIIVILSLILIATSAVIIHADDNRGNGFLMLEEPISPRNAAMGSAGTALGGYGFRYYNPVQPFFSLDMSSYASAEFGRMPGDVNRGGIETAVLFPEWFSAVSFFSSSVDFRTSDEHGLGAMASSGMTVGALSVGYIRDNLAIGAGLSMVEDDIWVGSTYSAFALSVGLGYKLFDEKLSLGAAWMNGLGWSRGFVGAESSWQEGKVPMFARAGVAWTDTLFSLPYTIAADAVYRDEDGTLSAPIGLEVKALPYISLRIGKRIGWETEIMSFGIGLNIDRLSFDATFIPTVFVSDYEMKWSMGFTYTMGGKRKPIPVKEEAPIKESVPTEEPVSKEEESVSPEESTPPEEESVSTEESESIEESTPTEETIPAE